MAIKKVPKQMGQITKMNSNTLDPNRLSVSTNQQQIADFQKRVNQQAGSSILSQTGAFGQLFQAGRSLMSNGPAVKGTAMVRAQASGALGVATVGLALANKYFDNIGWFTNDQTAQNKVSNIKNITGRVGSIAGSAAAGAAIGGPVGAAIGAVTGVALQAIDMAMEAQKIARNIRDSNRQSAFDSQRLGLIYSSKGRA